MSANRIPPVQYDRQQLDAWMKEARGGSSEAIARLIDACRNFLLVIANQELPVSMRAKIGPSDIVQDTLFEAHRDFARFEGEQVEQLLAWLRRILLNNAASVHRRFRTNKRDVAREIAMDSGVPHDGLASTQPTPGALAIVADQQQKINRALRRLPADMRRAIQLRHQEHLSFIEIGEGLNRSPEAARKLWARAVERLRKEITNSDATR